MVHHLWLILKSILMRYSPPPSLALIHADINTLQHTNTCIAAITSKTGMYIQNQSVTLIGAPKQSQPRWPTITIQRAPRLHNKNTNICPWLRIYIFRKRLLHRLEMQMYLLFSYDLSRCDWFHVVIVACVVKNARKPVT